ncbi:hypothetical protein BJ742DRAFT_866465 [Cladochytrium replicatum]|nr:hypothetical protein BJ742DRAFT_866465 [Cladochytrium replicatum]
MVFGPRQLEASIAKQYYLQGLAILAVWFAFVAFLYGQAYAPNPSSIVIYVVDLDGGVVGSTLTTAVSKLINDSQATGALLPAFTIVSGETFDDVVAKVSAGDAWGAIVANKGASTALQSALASAIAATSRNSTADAAVAPATTLAYNASLALTIVFDEGRQSQVVSSAVAGPLRTLAARIGTQYALVQASRGTTLGSLVGTPFSGLIVSPISYTEVNIHPSTAPVVAVGVALGNTFLMVASIFGTVLLLSKTQSPEVVEALRPVTIISIRIRLVLPYAILLSLLSTVLYTIFGVKWSPVENFFGAWFLQCLTSLVYIGLFTIILSIPKIGLPPALSGVLALLVVFNVIGGLAVVDLASPFYKFGYGFPIYNAASGLRTLIFGSYNRIGLNVGVLFAWLVCCSIVSLAVVLSGFERKRILAGVAKITSEKEVEDKLEEEQGDEVAPTATNQSAA